jgi:hypothetical protein
MLSQCYLKQMQSNKQMTYIQDIKLRNIVIKIATEHSSMFYFHMEANDNLAFYSTLPFASESLFREITVYCTPELSEQLDTFLEHFHKTYPITIISDQIIQD